MPNEDSPATRAEAGHPAAVKIFKLSQPQLVLLIMTVSLTATWFLITQEHGWGGDHNLITSFIFTAMSGLNHIGPNYNVPNPHEHFEMCIDVWKGRIGSLWLAGQWLHFLNPGSVAEINFAIGFWEMFWLIATLYLLWISQMYSLEVLLFLFVGLIFSLVPDVAMFPWDMPSMFFWTLTYILWSYRKYSWMIPVLILGTLFKETVAVLALLLLMSGDLLKWKRGLCFSICFLGCLAVRLMVTHSLGHAEVANYDGKSTFTWNLLWHRNLIKFIMTPLNFEFLFLGGGTFLCAMILPIDKKIKIIVLVFTGLLIADALLSNTNFEFRQWNDILPLLAIQLSRLPLFKMEIPHRVGL